MTKITVLIVAQLAAERVKRERKGAYACRSSGAALLGCIVSSYAMFLLPFFLLRSVFLDDEVVDDEVLALHGVLAHVVFQ